MVPDTMATYKDKAAGLASKAYAYLGGRLSSLTDGRGSREAYAQVTDHDGWEAEGYGTEPGTFEVARHHAAAADAARDTSLGVLEAAQPGGAHSFSQEDADFQAGTSYSSGSELSAKENWSPGGSPQRGPLPLLPGRYYPEVTGESCILLRQNFAELCAALPVRHRWRRWVLVYSSARDGVSLSTLYRHGAGVRQSVLVVRDTEGYVFGCFAAAPWRIDHKLAPRAAATAPPADQVAPALWRAVELLLCSSQHKKHQCSAQLSVEQSKRRHTCLPVRRYYGTGESFVFQLHPKQQLYRWQPPALSASPTQGRTDFFQYGQPDSLALGGGSAYALRLDGDLVFGSSGPCDTFGSPCLAGRREFEVGKVELWGLT